MNMSTISKLQERFKIDVISKTFPRFDDSLTNLIQFNQLILNVTVGLQIYIFRRLVNFDRLKGPRLSSKSSLTVTVQIILP